MVWVGVTTFQHQMHTIYIYVYNIYNIYIQIYFLYLFDVLILIYSLIQLIYIYCNSLSGEEGPEDGYRFPTARGWPNFVPPIRKTAVPQHGSRNPHIFPIQCQSTVWCWWMMWAFECNVCVFLRCCFSYVKGNPPAIAAYNLSLNAKIWHTCRLTNLFFSGSLWSLLISLFISVLAPTWCGHFP